MNMDEHDPTPPISTSDIVEHYGDARVAPEAPRRSAGVRDRRVIAGVLALVLAVGAGVGGLAGSSGETTVSPDDVPLVTADTSPTKRRPEEPGGMAIPDQDKLVYGLIDPTSQDGEVVERLLPPPEEPMTVEPLAPAVEPEPVTIGDALAGSATSELGTGLEAVDEPEIGAIEAAEAALADLAPAAGAEAPLPPTPPEPLATVASAEPEPTTPTGRVWRVQVGAVKDSAQVEAEWKRLKSKLGPLVAGLTTTVETADLGSEQGLYHRLQVGAFTERTGADGLCQEFKRLKVDCLVVRR